MTTTAVIISQTTADTYVFTIPSGVRRTFACSDLAGVERITIEKKKGDGSYDLLTYNTAADHKKVAEMTVKEESITLSGPFEGMVSKPPTANDVEVVEYT